ncbi:LrgB family protein, partial [Clostridiaceae bacterium HSG29]|nr:LrgB family protein [Clostridiaceae bacterium HSG29]
YKLSTNWITFLLNPIVVMLAIPLYKNKDSLKKNYAPIIIGIISSIIISIIAVFGLSLIMNLDQNVMISLFPKSITTPMALEVTSLLNGNEGLTVVFVVLTGIIGATFANFTLNLFKINHPIAKGIAIGASSHGIGTSKAITISEETGSASGLAMGLSGVITVISFSIISNFFL